MHNEFYVYIHLDPRNNLIRYCGKGQKRRAWDFNRRSDYHKNWINELKNLGLEPLVEIIEVNKTEQDAYFLEQLWIAAYRAVGLPMTNLCDGGKGGCSGYKHTEEHKRYISKKLKGRVFTKEHIDNLSSSLKGHNNGWLGKTHTQETKLKISSKRKGTKASEETKIKMSKTRAGIAQPKKSKPVKGLNLQTLQEVVFASQKAAAQFIDCSYQLIGRVCSGRQKQTNGWKFELIQEAA